MRMSVYFIISPHKDLIGRIVQSGDSERWSDFLRQRLWSAEMPDKGMLKIEEYELLVKILFLDSVRTECVGILGFETIFPEFLVAQEYFDSNWYMQQLECENSVEFALEVAIGDDGNRSFGVVENQRIEDYILMVRQRRQAK